MNVGERHFSGRMSHRKILYLVIAVAAVALGILHIFNTWSEYIQKSQHSALVLAEAAEAFVPADLVMALEVSPDDIEKAEYQQLKESLMLFKARNEGVHFAYLYTLIDDKIYFMVDSERPDTDDYSPPGQEYYEATADDISAFTEGNAIFTRPITDRWGTWVSALVPVMDMQAGKAIAVFGVDYSAAQWRAELVEHVLQAVIMMVCVWLLLLALCLTWTKNTALKALGKKLEESETLFRTIFEQAPVGIAIVNGYEFLSNMNTLFEQMLGRSKEDLAALNWADVTHPDDLEQDLELFKKFRAGEINGYSMEKRFVKPDGSHIWVHMAIAALQQGNQPGHRHLCIIRDITQSRLAAEALHESERSKSVLLAHLPGMAYRRRYDKDYTMEFLSEGCIILTGYKPESLIGNRDLPFSQLIFPKYRGILLGEWKRVLALRIPFRYEYEIKTATGQLKWVLEMGQGIFDKNGNVESLEGIIVDITESKQQLFRIEHMNDHDFLTGLYNRRYYEAEKIRLDQKEFLPFTIMIMDIDGVRLINDAFGHSEGDQMINETARIIQSCCRNSDILARTGGGEFEILMPNTGQEEAYAVLCKIKEACNKFNLSISNTAQYIYLSIGFGTKQASEPGFGETEKEAEAYMIRRKLLQRKSYHNAVLSSIMATMYASSQETEAHAQRLALLSTLIGEALQLPQKSLDDLQLFSMLHDIGKVGIDSRILNKPGSLNDEEWAIMKKHPELGYRIALASPELESISVLILTHHERWDGRGYPRGLKGESIPLLSRILSVVDAYDAMTEDRIYRKALTTEHALQEIYKNSGTQFAPDIAALFIRIVEAEGSNGK